nr:c-type cytochrome [Loktanella sp. Alg231-35]
MDIAVSPSGQIATASFDNAVGVWDRSLPVWYDGHRAAVNVATFWTDEIILSAGDDFDVLIWTDPQSPRVLGQHDAKVLALAVSHEAEMAASASWDATVGLWPLELDGQDGTAAPIKLRGHRQGVNDVVFSNDGKRLFSASTDGTIRVWDVASGTQTHLLASHGFGVNELVLNEADGWLAYGAVDGSTRFIDPHTGDLLRDITLERRPILSLAYDDNSRQLAVGDGDGYIMLVDTTDMSIARDFRATQQGPVWALAFSPDGLNIHAGGIDNTMYSWPIETMSLHEPMNAEIRSFLEDPDVLENGERQYKRKCSICHTVTEGSERRAGPTLHQLFGRPAGTVPDYSYSATLLQADIVWSAATINALFDEGPDHYIPGTKMPMQRIAGQQDRDDLIDYLQRVTARNGDLE